MQIKLPTHEKNSYKGQVGKVLVVGGSERYYGAPILTALGAEHSGADLVTLYMPAQHVQTAKNYSLNFFIKEFRQAHLSKQDVAGILEESERHHALVIGNGLGGHKETVMALLEVLNRIKIPTVVDAEGLIPESADVIKKRRGIFTVTPHKAEFERVFGCSAVKEKVSREAKAHDLTILLTGPQDIVASSDGEVFENKIDCSQLRVGGTGDVLAGIVGSFIAQGLDPYMACCSAAYHFSKCGEELMKEQKWLTAYNLATYFSEMV